MKNVLSAHNLGRMIALVKAALHGSSPDDSLFVNITEADWKEIFQNAVKQGVMVLSLEGAIRLPKELQPPLAVKLPWIAGMEAVENRYRHCLESAEKLSAYFKENNIRMLIFKGFSLSRIYPVASSREFGDIDIFLCGKAKEGDVLLEQISDRKLPFTKKNVNFTYRGILIENHHTFLYHSILRGFHCSENLEKRLLKLLAEAGIFPDTTLAAPKPVGETLLFPPPDFDALYVTLHLLSHFPFEIVLRQLCDLTVLFTVYKGKIDFASYREALSEAGLSKVADVFISLSIKYLGLKPEDAPSYQSDEDLENRIWNNMLHPAFTPSPIKKQTSFTIFIRKIRFLLSGYWKFELIFPGKYWKRIFRSIFFHISHPQIIGKLKK